MQEWFVGVHTIGQYSTGGGTRDWESFDYSIPLVKFTTSQVFFAPVYLGPYLGPRVKSQVQKK